MRSGLHHSLDTGCVCLYFCGCLISFDFQAIEKVLFYVVEFHFSIWVSVSDDDLFAVLVGAVDLVSRGADH